MRSDPTITTPPLPSSHFGATPGDDRVLIRWQAMLGYFRELAAASDRLRLEPIGLSTEGREMVMVVISEPSVIRDLEAHRSLRSRLVDEELLRDPAMADGAVAGSRTVVLVTSAIHATEVGSVQLCPELIHRLATSDDDETVRMLERTILLIVPSLNPDGMELVHDWYQQTLGTAAEGSVPPALYHRYAGHDNNRDWVHHQLVETQHLIRDIHRAWRPHIVLDLHQMMSNGPRYFVPPYIDPIEPNVAPSLIAGGNALGSHIAARMVAKELAGTATGVLFDAFSPARAYSHYHGGVRILAEAASARIATPIRLTADELATSRGFDPGQRSVHNPLPWMGGTWRLRDIMDYHREAVLATVDHAARHRESWLRWQWSALARHVREPSQRSFVMPPLEHQDDPAAAAELLRILDAGEVRIGRLERSAVDSEGGRHARGSFLIPSQQPFAGWAEALLPPTAYPDPGTGFRPYDTTSHSLSVHMGVDVDSVKPGDDWEIQSTSPSDLAGRGIQSLDIHRSGQGRWLALDARSHAAMNVVNAALANGARVRRLVRAHFTDGRVLDPGTWLLTGVPAGLRERAEASGVRSWSIMPVAGGMVEQKSPRVGVHIASLHNATDAGWTRLVLEQHGVAYDVLRDWDVIEGDLDPYDVILLPHLKASALVEGNKDGDYPAPYAGGLGEHGLDRLHDFVERGGHVVAIDGAAQALVGHYGLPIEMPLAGVDDATFYAPGAAVRTLVDATHPLGWGLPPVVAAMVHGKTPFRRTAGSTSLTAPFRYAADHLVVSGWIQGEQHLAGLDAELDVPIGQGRLVLMSFRPQFRAQMHATYNVLFNALYRAGLEVPR
ncbi:MAG TPA: M14 family zinc carboxypeptidase [Thermomicrobiales bacterium]|nr:M14 family zinc carboxypeptidase [Thermomicrobiales bacterium]